jgi:hypothetical protein
MKKIRSNKEAENKSTELDLSKTSVPDSLPARVGQAQLAANLDLVGCRHSAICSTSSDSTKVFLLERLLAGRLRSAQMNRLRIGFLPFCSILAAAALLGCAWGDFTPYSGQQQNWPMQPGAFVTTQYAIPVYMHSYPNRPYNVIGYLDATTAPIRRRGVVAFAAQKAKELGADAIIVLQQGQEYAGSISTGSAYTFGNFYPGGFNASTTGTAVSGPLFRGRAQVIAIKWR